MPGLLNQILVGRYNRFAQKFLSMKGPAALPQLAGELQFVLPLFHGAENRYLEGWDLFGLATFAAAPGAGNASTFALRNPLTSNVLAVVTRLQQGELTLNGTAILTEFRPGTAGANAGDENTAQSTQGFDGRGRGASSLVASTNSAGAVVRTGGFQTTRVIQTVANALLDVVRVGEEIPMTPGTLLTMVASTLNEGQTIVCWWRERFLEDSERT